MNEDAAGVDLLGSELMGESHVFLFTLSYFIIAFLPTLTSLAVSPSPSLLNIGKELVSFTRMGVCIG